MLQEFDLEIKDRKGTENQVADHLSRLENREHVNDDLPILETFPDEQLFVAGSVPWYADFVNYLVSRVIPEEFNYQQKKRFLHQVKFYR